MTYLCNSSCHNWFSSILFLSWSSGGLSWVVVFVVPVVVVVEVTVATVVVAVAIWQSPLSKLHSLIFAFSSHTPFPAHKFKVVSNKIYREMTLIPTNFQSKGHGLVSRTLHFGHSQNFHQSPQQSPPS